MRISELAERSGMAVATVKYYLREGLLPPGAPITPRLADYDESHVQRLRLLRVLREVGRIPITNLRALVTAVELRETLHGVLGAAADALAPTPPSAGPARREAQRLAAEIIDRAGWQVRSDSVDRDNLAAVLETFIELVGAPPAPSVVDIYTGAADRLAEWEIASLDPSGGPDGLLRQMVIGQVLLGELLTVARRLAEESHSARRFGALTPHDVW